MAKGRTTVIEWTGDWLKAARSEGGRLIGVGFRRATEEPATALRELMGELPGDPGRVIAVLPRSMATLRILEFPSLDPREIRDMVELQIGRVTPYSRDEMVSDFKIIGSERAGYGRVLLAIAPSSAARRCFSLAEEGGLTVERLTVGTEALMEAPGVRDLADGAVLDLDAGAAEFCVRRRGQPAHSRTLPVGAAELGPQAVEAEHRLLQEFHRAVDGYRNEHPGARLETVRWTGAALPDAEGMARLRAEAGVAVEPAPADAELSEAMRARMAEASAAGVSLSAVMGAARAPERLMLNLIPDAVVSRRALERRARQLTALGVLILAGLALVSLGLAGRMVRRQALLSDLRRQVAETDPAAARVEARTHQARMAGARLDGRATTARILAELHALLPETVTVTAIQMDRAAPADRAAPVLTITLRGQAPTVGDTVRLVGLLEASPVLANVRSTRTASGRDKTDFEIVCEGETP